MRLYTEFEREGQIQTYRRPRRDKDRPIELGTSSRDHVHGSFVLEEVLLIRSDEKFGVGIDLEMLDGEILAHQIINGHPISILTGKIK